MRFLLGFLVVLVIAWRWRAWRESKQLMKRNTPSDPAVASDMLSCKQCGLHIPANEAIAGKLGSYCSTDHRRQMEP